MFRNAYRDFIHPEDEFARRQLESIPGFPALVKAFLNLGPERMLHGVNIVSKLKLSKTQLPKIYAILENVCKVLKIEIPELYLEMNPLPNAYTMGDTRVFITITSGLVEALDDDELTAVIAHECGHIVCRHVLYNTVAHFLTLPVSDIGLNLGGILISPIKLALRYWNRRAELSADRCAAIACKSTDPVVETMVRFAAGPKSLTDSINLEEFVNQSQQYDQLIESKWDKFLQYSQVMHRDHPFPAIRVKEILNWGKTETFHRLINHIVNNGSNSCPNCYNEISDDWRFCKNCGYKLDE